MEAFLTFIVFLFLFFWLVGRFGPLLLAWWIKRKVNKFAGQGRGFSAEEGDYKEGETFVKNNKSQTKIVDKNIGEYVDYEETKDEATDNK